MISRLSSTYKLDAMQLAASAARAEAAPSLSVVIPKKRGSDAMSPKLDSLSPTSKQENAIVVVARKKKKKDKKKNVHKKKKKKKKKKDDEPVADSGANTTAQSEKVNQCKDHG